MLGGKSGMVRAKVRDTDPRMAFWYAKSADGLDIGISLGALTLGLCQTIFFHGLLQIEVVCYLLNMTKTYNFIKFQKE